MALPIATARNTRRRGSLFEHRQIKDDPMLGTIAAILVVLWLLGFFAFHVGSGLIHLLLVIAVVMVILHFVTGRRTV
jgi:uncharacterized metal-binding protein